MFDITPGLVQPSVAQATNKMSDSNISYCIAYLKESTRKQILQLHTSNLLLAIKTNKIGVA